MTTLQHPILEGLNGWHRWSHYAAHYFVDGRQLCAIQHGLFDAAKDKPMKPKPAELSAHGVPYGKTCSICLKRHRRRTQ